MILQPYSAQLQILQGSSVRTGRRTCMKAAQASSMHPPERTPQTRRRQGLSSPPQTDQEAALQPSARQVRTHAAKVSESSTAEGQNLLVAQLCIAACALLWGTYAPALRLAYNSPFPPDPAVVTAVRAAIQATVLYVVLQLQTNDQGKLPEEVSQEDGDGARASQASPLGQLDASRPLQSVRQLLNTTSSSFSIMGAELGFWNFAATVAQVQALA